MLPFAELALTLDEAEVQPHDLQRDVEDGEEDHEEHAKDDHDHHPLVDGIGQCADYLLHREGIETVFVYGVIGNSFIDGSLRTKSHTLDPDKWIKNVFGKDQDDKWYGGGRKDKGGFQIPLGVFSKCTDKELLWILIKNTIDELFYEKIGVDKKSSRENELSGKV